MARSLLSPLSAPSAPTTRARVLVRSALALAITHGSSTAFAQSVCDQTGGVPPVAAGGSAFACGDGANASGGTSTAVGTDAVSAGGNSSAFGADSTSAGDFSSALGRSADSSGAASTAVGFNAAASAANAMAFGSNSLASGVNAVAVGTGASASGADSTALGNAASATAANAVALGAGSVADEDNTVSVGAAGAERKVTHMAAGVADTDGVNVSQLNQSAATTLASANAYTDAQADATLTEANTYTDQVAGDTLTQANTYTDQVADDTLGAANSYTDQQVNQIGGMANSANAALAQFRAEADDRFAGIDERLNGMSRAIDDVNDRISRDAAMTAALVQSSGMPDVGENYFGVGVGWSEGEHAIAASFRRRYTEHFTASVGGARSGDISSVGLGGGWTW